MAGATAQTLTEPQIERFSRQIVLPEIGGVGQVRLLRAAVAIGGDGALADIVALYLAGAGVGRLALLGSGAAARRDAVRALGSDVEASAPAGPLAACEADVLVACDPSVAEIDPIAASGRRLVAAGAAAGRGWLAIAGPPDACAACAIRAVPRTAASPVPMPATGVIGSLAALAVVKLLLGRDGGPRGVWRAFDAARSTLTEQPLARAADCLRCAPR